MQGNIAEGGTSPEGGHPRRDVTWGTRSARGADLVRLGLWALAFYAAGMLGIATVVDGRFAMVWPVAGVGVLWLAGGSLRTWSRDAAVMLAVVALYSLAAPPPWLLSFVSSGFATLVQCFVVITLVRRTAPDLQGMGGGRPFDRVRDLGALLLAAAVAGVLGALVQNLAQVVITHDATWVVLLLRACRNVVALVVVVASGLLVVPSAVAAVRQHDAWPALRATLTPYSALRGLETAGLWATTAALCTVCFAMNPDVPIAFALLVATVWAGLRYSPTAVALHGLAIGTVAIFFTLHGHGVFGAIDDVATRVVMAQLFVLAITVTGLALALSHAELNRAHEIESARARELSLLVSHLHEGLTVVEQGGRLLLQNPAVDTVTGMAVQGDEHVRPVAEYGYHRPDGTPLVEDDLPHLRALRGQPVRDEVVHVRRRAEPDRVLEWSATRLPVLHPSEMPRAVVTVRDITLQQQQYDALAAFTGVVAHDLKSPLTVVQGWTETLQDLLDEAGVVDRDTATPMLRRIAGASTHMREFIGSLLAYTVARDQSLQPEAIPLDRLVTASAELRIDATTAGQPPCIRVDADDVVWADPLLLRQVVDNLIGNAVKYVAPGVVPRVEVRSTRLPDGDVELTITDNGIGIPTSQRTLVFETFHRVQQEAYHGTGLGLAICKRTVERHGGTIRVTEGPGGRGSAFVLTLPGARPALSDAPPTPVLIG